MTSRLERRAYRKALADEIKRVVTERAKAKDFAVGFVRDAADELGWTYVHLSYALTNHTFLRKWWARFKVEAQDVRRKKRRARARRRAAERALGYPLGRYMPGQP